jgi:hypothetical protein
LHYRLPYSPLAARGEGFDLSDPEITLEQFTAIVRRAGLRLSSGDIAMLFGEVAGSCAIVRGMTDRIRARLSPETEPAHLFNRTPGNGTL